MSDQDSKVISRFRPVYRQLSPDEAMLSNSIKEKAEELAVLYAHVNPGRYNSLAMTSLEQSVMWIIKELTS